MSKIETGKDRSEVAVQPSPKKLTAEKKTSPADKVKPRWTDEDEDQLRALLARRKSAGFRKPSRDVGGQLLKVGSFSPNPNTVTASICGLIALKGTITRRELLADMAETIFPHPKAQPKDPKWCQGWVAGAIRNGFVVIVEDVQSPPADTAAQTPVRVAVSALKPSEV